MPILATVILDSGCFVPMPDDSDEHYAKIGYFGSSRSVSDICVRADGADAPCKNSMNLGKKCEIEVRHVKADGTIKKDGVFGVEGYHDKILHLSDLYDADDIPVIDFTKFDCTIRFDSGVFSPALVKPRYFKKLSKQATGEFAAQPEERKLLKKLVAHNVHVNFKLKKGERLELARDGEVFWSSNDEGVNVKERLEIEFLADNTTAEKFYRTAVKGKRESYWLPNQGDPPPICPLPPCEPKRTTNDG
ncbi:MAG TPA: hypothetical protein VLR90_05580 [Blastocatellia bacterium]|nr:hypothetical protein [Blastocatellia bacterium]